MLPFGLIWVVVGGLMFLVSVIMKHADDTRKARCIEPVTATVIRYAVYEGDEGGVGYSPVYEYIYKAVAYRSHTNFYSSAPAYRIGDIVGIMVDPSDPNRIYVPSDKTGNSMVKIFKIVGIASIAFGFCFTIAYLVLM